MNEGEAQEKLIELWVEKADRQGGDYIPTAAFEASDVSASLQKAREFMDLIRGLLGAG